MHIRASDQEAVLSVCPSIGDVRCDRLVRCDFDIFQMSFTGNSLLPRFAPWSIQVAAEGVCLQEGPSYILQKRVECLPASA